MRSKLLKLFLLLTAFILLVGLACNAAAPDAPVEEPQDASLPSADVEAPASPPTDVPPPTAVPEPTQPPVQRFFTEEFDGDTSNWEYFHFGDDNANYDITTDGDRLVFNIPDENIYVYDIYNAQEYDNVRLETEVNNRGYNNNNVSLVCRLDPDEGWYEFSIANNGLYWVFAYDIAGGSGYNQIANGGVQNIKTGKETNQYTIVCKEKTLSLYVNGKEIKTFDENKFSFKEGMIGVSVSSFDVVPINVEFEWVKIMEP